MLCYRDVEKGRKSRCVCRVFGRGEVDQIRRPFHQYLPLLHTFPARRSRLRWPSSLCWSSGRPDSKRVDCQQTRASGSTGRSLSFLFAASLVISDLVGAYSKNKPRETSHITSSCYLILKTRPADSRLYQPRLISEGRSSLALPASWLELMFLRPAPPEEAMAALMANKSSSSPSLDLLEGQYPTELPLDQLQEMRNPTTPKLVLQGRRQIVSSTDSRL